MSTLVEQVRGALDFAARIPFLAPSAVVAALGPEVVSAAAALCAAQRAALAPYAAGPLPEVRVEPYARPLAVLRRLGLPVADPVGVAPLSRTPFTFLAPTLPGLRPSPVAVGPTAPPTPPGAPPALPAVTPAMRRLTDAAASASTRAVDDLRADPQARQRLRALGDHLGVRATADDPHHALAEILAEPLRVARWEHPHRALSERVPCLIEQPHQTGARALEAHLRWLVTYGDDPRRPSPWWPALQLWSLGLWPIPAQDGALLALAAPVVEGRVVVDAATPTAPWPTLGARVSPGAGDGWEPLDEHCRALLSLGLGPVPGAFSVLHGNPPGVPPPR